MMRVIVIDDDHDTVRTLSTLLEMKGVSVEAKGYDGKEAVELFRKHQPDAVLLDMLMPEFDGKYAIKNLKKENKNVKIIVLTAYKHDYEFEKDEVAAVFDKPYKITDLIQAIAQ
jgi:two-component system, chemotaxis family, chemotaxis protein CheY